MSDTKTTKYLSFKKREGELYIKITDAFRNKIYETTVGINDKKGIARVITELKHKGVDFIIPPDSDIEWW